ncbi:hypothetical protein M0R45_030153 [Rubus argutus]|uniref:Uncharacterized protein n=1 Tax=Rubus argutus TaxID=59490 RepID=A0AAW1WCP4_RUBAR
MDQWSGRSSTGSRRHRRCLKIAAESGEAVVGRARFEVQRMVIRNGSVLCTGNLGADLVSNEGAARVVMAVIGRLDWFQLGVMDEVVVNP